MAVVLSNRRYRLGKNSPLHPLPSIILIQSAHFIAVSQPFFDETPENIEDLLTLTEDEGVLSRGRQREREKEPCGRVGLLGCC